MCFAPEKIAGTFDLYGSCVHVLLFRYWPCHPLTRVAVGWLLFPMAGTAILFWFGKSFSLLRPRQYQSCFRITRKSFENLFSDLGTPPPAARRQPVIPYGSVTRACQPLALARHRRTPARFDPGLIHTAFTRKSCQPAKAMAGTDFSADV